MMHSHFRSTACKAGERRLLRVTLVPGGSFNKNKDTADYAVAGVENHEAFVNDPNMKGARDVFNFFAERDAITSNDLRGYLQQRQAAGSLTEYEQKMHAHFAVLANPGANDAEKLAASERDVQHLVDYINSRNAMLKKQRAEIKNFQANGNEQLFSEKVIGTAKGTLSLAADRLKRADLAEKGMLIGGAVSAFLILRFLYAKMPGKGILKNTLGIVLGGALTYAAGETLLKGGKTAMQSKEQWSAARHERELEQVNTMLKQQYIPEDFIQSLGENEKKVSAPLANIATMQAEEFLALYQGARSSKSIDDLNPLYPKKPVRKDGLRPVERFKLVEDVAQGVGLVDERGNVLAQPKSRQGKSMLYLMLDWKNSPNAKNNKGGNNVI